MTSGGVDRYALTSVWARLLKPFNIGTGCAGCRPAATQWSSVPEQRGAAVGPQTFRWRVAGLRQVMCELHHYTRTCVRPTRALESHGADRMGARLSQAWTLMWGANGDAVDGWPSARTHLRVQLEPSSAQSALPPRPTPPQQEGTCQAVLFTVNAGLGSTRASRRTRRERL